MGRARNIIHGAETNAHLWPISGLIKMWQICPAKFNMNKERASAKWTSRKPANPDRAVSLLRIDAPQQGLSRTAYPLRSHRAVGAHRSTLRPVKSRFRPNEKMGNKFHIPYLWEGRGMMRGLVELIAHGDHTLRHATRDSISIRPTL